jgi:putative inorganic carbon (HCO3(-)) transporter
LLLNVDAWTERTIWLLLSAEALYGWWNNLRIAPKFLRDDNFALPSAPPVQTETESEILYYKERFHTIGDWLEKTRLIWIAGLLPLFLFGEGHYILYGLGALAILWSATGITSGRWRQCSPADGLMLVWLGLIPVTLWATPAPEITRPFLGYYLAELLAFYAVLTWVRNEKRFWLVAWGLVGLGVGLALSSLVLLQQGGRFFPALGFITRLASSLPQTAHKNIMGGLLSVIVPLSLGLILAQTKGKFYRARLVVSGLSFAIIIGALVITQSRGAWLAAGLALLLMGLLGLGQLRGLLMGVGLLGLGVAGLLISGQFNSLLAQVAQSDALGGLEGRLEVWARASSALHDYAFTGIGLGSFDKVIPAFYPYFFSSPEPVPHAHNLFLQVGLDLGLPGLINFLALLILSAAGGFSAWQRWGVSNNKKLSWIVLGGLGSLLALLTHGLLDAVTSGTKPAFLAWAIAGLLLASGLLIPSKTSSSN